MDRINKALHMDIVNIKIE
jgi:hypothetical protein